MDRSKSRIDPCLNYQNSAWGGKGHMTWKTAKHHMGVQDNNEDIHKGDTISANVLEQSGHSNRGQTHKLQSGQSRWKQKWRSCAFTARSSGRGEANIRTKAHMVLGPHGQALQLLGQTQRLAGWRSHFKEGDGRCQKPYSWEAQTQLGRTLQNHVMAEERHLPPRDTWQTKVALSMERRAPMKVLPVEMIEEQHLLFPFYFS